MTIFIWVFKFFTDSKPVNPFIYNVTPNYIHIYIMNVVGSTWEFAMLVNCTETRYIYKRRLVVSIADLGYEQLKMHLLSHLRKT